MRKFLQRLVHSGFCRDVWTKRGASIKSALVDGDEFEVLTIGAPREPFDFLAKAVEAGHPKTKVARASRAMQSAVTNVFSSPVESVLEKRSAFLKKYLKRALALRDEEQQLHNKLPDHLKRILAGKKLLLFKEMLSDLDYSDTSVVDDVVSGFQLTGWARNTGVFDVKVRPPTLTVQQLEGMSLGLNKAVVGSLSSDSFEDIDQVAWDETMEEVSRGWLSECGEVNLRHHFIAKRFPIQQKEKVRLIGDFSINGVNATFGLCERLRVESIDEVATVLALGMKVLKDSGVRKSVSGRTFDLKSAYKQFGVCVEDMNRLKIAVKKPEGGVAYFNVLALPFGATGSVAAFLRVSSALAHIGVHGLLLPWTSFFDDFTVVSVEGGETQTCFFVEW